MSIVYGATCFITIKQKKEKRRRQTYRTNAKKALRTNAQGPSVERSHLASWQCKASHSSPTGADHQQPGLETAPSSPLTPQTLPLQTLTYLAPWKSLRQVQSLKVTIKSKVLWATGWDISLKFFMLREYESSSTDGKNLWHWWETRLKKKAFIWIISPYTEKFTLFIEWPSYYDDCWLVKFDFNGFKKVLDSVGQSESYSSRQKSILNPYTLFPP